MVLHPGSLNFFGKEKFYGVETSLSFKSLKLKVENSLLNFAESKVSHISRTLQSFY